MKTPKHVLQLKQMGACASGLAQARLYPTFQGAWDDCARGAFMEWTIQRLARLARGPRRAALHQLQTQIARYLVAVRDDDRRHGQYPRSTLPATSAPAYPVREDLPLAWAFRAACIRTVCPTAPTLPRLRKPKAKPKRRR